MKTYLLTIALLAMYACLHAQNWEPFVFGETHHFRSDTASFPDRSVRIDSARMVAGDSIWYFNRLLQRVEWDSADVNAPLFCGRAVQVQAGGVFQFLDPDTLTVKTLATVGDTWLIDAAHQQMAVVASIYEDSVLGNLDSLKVILIDSIDTLLLSKTHGLMAWPAVLGSPHYTKVGIQERHLGDTLPGFDGIFGHAVGNIYYWYCYAINEVGETTVYEWKMHVDSVDRDSGGMQVFWSGLVMGGLQIAGFWNIRDSVGFVVQHGHQDAIRDYMCMHPYTLDYRWSNNCYSSGNDFYQYPTNAWTTTRWERVQDSMILSVGVGSQVWDSPIFYPNGSPDALAASDDREYCIFRTGLGITEISWRRFEGEGQFKMVGYIVGEDTVGTIWPDSVLLNGRTQPLAYHWQAFPNPAQDRISISLQGADEGMLRLYSMSGQAIRTWQVNASISQFELSAIPAGMYLLQLVVDGQIDHRKLVVRR